MARTDNRPRKTSKYNLLGAFELFPKSYELVKRYLAIFGLLYLFPAIFGLANGFVGLESERHWKTDAPVAANAVNISGIPFYVWAGLGVGLLALMVVAVILRIMLHTAQLRASEGHKPKFGQLWQTVKSRGWDMFKLYLLVSIMTIIGFLLLIIPGIIMLRRYFVAPYVMLDNENQGVWEAMQRSAAMTKPYSGKIYAIFGVMILFALVGIVPLIGWIGATALAFFYNLAPALRYQELKKIVANT